MSITYLASSHEARMRMQCSKRLLWKAPELLRNPSPPPRGTQKGDVFSFGIILYEIIGRKGPWGDLLYTMSPKRKLDAELIFFWHSSVNFGQKPIDLFQNRNRRENGPSRVFFLQIFSTTHFTVELQRIYYPLYARLLARIT